MTSIRKGSNKHEIELHDRTGEAQLSAPLVRGGRLLIEAGGGPITATRSPTEHKLLSSVMGRALALLDVDPADVVVVALPRSSRTKKLSVQLRAAPRLRAAGLSFFLVSRNGPVDGIQLIARK